MSMMKTFLRYWGPAILIMTVIFVFSSIPSESMPRFGILDYLVKKGGHALGYGILGLAYLRGVRGNNPTINFRHLLLAWILATMYSATDEFHQSFVPGRHPALTDVLIDSVGAAITLYLVGWYFKQKRLVH